MAFFIVSVCMTADENKDAKTILQKAETLVKERNETCKELLAIINNDNAAKSDRARAVDLIYEMQYLDAIPTLIDKIISIQYREMHESEAYPVKYNFICFKNAGVPFAIEAFINLDNSQSLKKKAIKMELADNRIIKYSMIYSLGLQQSGGLNAGQAAALKELLEWLDEVEKSRKPK